MLFLSDQSTKGSYEICPGESIYIEKATSTCWLVAEPQVRNNRTSGSEQPNRPTDSLSRAIDGRSRLAAGQQPVVGERVPCVTHYQFYRLELPSPNRSIQIKILILISVQSFFTNK